MADAAKPEGIINKLFLIPNREKRRKKGRWCTSSCWRSKSGRRG